MLAKLLQPGRRYVLLLGSTGAVLAYVAGGRVQRVWHAAGGDAQSRQVFAQALGEHPRDAVVVLVDLLEQSYRKEAIPPVSLLDRSKVLARRLSIVYPTHDIKAALPLGEKMGTRGDLAYLFVALPMSSELESWIAFLHSIGNPVSRIGLLPLESAGLAEALIRAVGEPGEEAPEWVVLLTHQRTGGFRQIVVRRGKLALTRITPAPARQDDPHAAARSIEQEVTATLSYLARLGYTARQGLDAIVIGDDALRQALGRSRSMPVRKMHVLAPEEAGELVGLSGLAEEDGAFGELLHAAWFAGKRRTGLQLVAQVLGRRQIQLVAARRYAAAGLSAAAVLIALYCGYAIWNVGLLREDIARAEARVQQLRSKLEANRAAIENSPERPERMNVTLAIHGKLVAETVDPVPTLRAVSQALAPETRLTDLEWQVLETAGGGNRGGQGSNNEPPAPETTLDMTLDLQAVGEVEAAIEATESFAQRLRERLDGRAVDIPQPPLDILPTQTFTGSFDARQEVVAPTSLTARITVGEAQP